MAEADAVIQECSNLGYMPGLFYGLDIKHGLDGLNYLKQAVGILDDIKNDGDKTNFLRNFAKGIEEALKTASTLDEKKGVTLINLPEKCDSFPNKCKAIDECVKDAFQKHFDLY